MPAKGTKKREPKPKEYKQMRIEAELYSRLEAVAFANGLINPRNGEGNRSELIKIMLNKFEKQECQKKSTNLSH